MVRDSEACQECGQNFLRRTKNHPFGGCADLRRALAFSCKKTRIGHTGKRVAWLQSPSAGVVDREPTEDKTARQPPDVVAAGLTAVTVGAIVSWFGVPQTLLGAALTSMIGTTVSSVYKTYLRQATIRELNRPWIAWVLAALRSFVFRPSEKRRAILLRSLLAGLVACFLGVML